MKKDVALKIIIWLAIAGMIFSGWLSYVEIMQQTCALGNTCSKVFSIPACLYGFVMYLIVFAISIVGLRNKS